MPTHKKTNLSAYYAWMLLAAALSLITGCGTPHIGETYGEGGGESITNIYYQPPLQLSDDSRQNAPSTTVESIPRKKPVEELSTQKRLYSCNTLSPATAAALYKQGHLYLDRDGDGKPCEWKGKDKPQVPSYTRSKCSWVGSYRRKNGTYVRGYRRCR